ncbi:MAG: AAA family ATPase [Thermoplasmata archaeon]
MPEARGSGAMDDKGESAQGNPPPPPSAGQLHTDSVDAKNNTSAEYNELLNEIKYQKELNRELSSRIRKLEMERSALDRENYELQDNLLKLKQENSYLKTQLEQYQYPPLVIGFVEEVLARPDEDSKQTRSLKREVIVKDGNGHMFIVNALSKIPLSDLKPGVRVALDKNNLTILRVLTTAKDAIIAGAEIIAKPEVTYNDIGGLDEQVNEVREAVELPLLRPDNFKELGIKPPKGVLLVGPPGTGKTLIAKAVANATNATFIRMVGSELVQKFIGEGGRLVRELFAMAREKKPSIIFLDELDAIGAKRLGMDTTGDREVQRTLMQLLAEIDGFNPLESVSILAATNRVDIIDEALLRPGRFDRIVSIPIPDQKGLEKIFQIHMSKLKIAQDVTPGAVAAMASNFTGAQVQSACTEAGMFALRRNSKIIELSDFVKAIEKEKSKLNKGKAGAEGMFA